MDSPFSDARTTIASLGEAARRGDWRTVNELAATLAQRPLPAAQRDLAEYLRDLKDALEVAKTSRAHAAASLVRLKAAAGFHRAASLHQSGRQNIADAADS